MAYIRLVMLYHTGSGWAWHIIKGTVYLGGGLGNALS